MSKKGFWKTDWFLGLMVTLVLMVAGNSSLIQSLEYKAYDMGVQASSRAPSDKIAVIAIDDQSIANIGRWPWSRDIHAKLTDLLVNAKAKVITNTVFFSEPQVDPGSVYVNKLLEVYSKGAPAATPAADPAAPGTAPAAPVAAAVPIHGSPEVRQIGTLSQEAELALNTDLRPAESYTKAGNVLPPMIFQLGEPRGKPDNLLPVEKVVSIHARIADALGYAHKQNIVHRGIKPANIMYEPESDMPKVTDLGIARITDSSKTKTGMVLSTPSYMSPEQLSSKKVDGRSDLFSLSVSLYQMLCGALLFVGDSMTQLMFKIANEPATDILSVRPDLPPGLVAFLDQAISKDADQRFQSGDEFAAGLRAAFGGAAGAPAAGGGSADMDISL